MLELKWSVDYFLPAKSREYLSLISMMTSFPPLTTCLASQAPATLPSSQWLQQQSRSQGLDKRPRGIPRKLLPLIRNEGCLYNCLIHLHFPFNRASLNLCFWESTSRGGGVRGSSAHTSTCDYRKLPNRTGVITSHYVTNSNTIYFQGHITQNWQTFALSDPPKQQKVVQSPCQHPILKHLNPQVLHDVKLPWIREGKTERWGSQGPCFRGTPQRNSSSLISAF